MILDAIENAANYLHLGEGIAKALTYIQDNDLACVQPGRYELDNDRLVMIVFDYKNTNTNDYKLEGHRRYIDLQYWVAGSEIMGHDILKSQPVLVPYNEKADYAFYQCTASMARLAAGMFVIYYPTDLHTAIADPQSETNVKKIVFKIEVEA